MTGNIYIRSSLILIMVNSLIAIRGRTFRKTLTIGRNNEIAPEKEDHKALYEDYYQEAEVPVNYDFDYYPYKSYLYESNEEYDDAHHSLDKKHKTKRRGSREKTSFDKDTITKISSPKSRIKSQKKSKTNSKGKSRRCAIVEDPLRKRDNLYDDLSLHQEDHNIQRDSYLPVSNQLKNTNSYGSFPLSQQNKFPSENYTGGIESKVENNQDVVSGVYPFDRYKAGGKISPYDYLHIPNRSQNDVSDLNEGIKLKYEFSPSDFHSKSLNEILGEARHGYFPQCPAVHSNKNAAFSPHSMQTRKSEHVLDNRENMNFSDVIRRDTYSGNKLENRNEEYEIKSNKDIRAKREPKVKSFTLTFPAIGNVESFIGPEPQSRKGAKGSKISINALPQCTTCSTTQCTTLSTCSTEEECTTPSKCTTECVHSTSEECTTESKCTRPTTCPSNFKELNEGSKIVMDLSNYVAGMFHPPVLNATVSNPKSKRQKFILANSEDTIIPLLRNKIGVIKLQSNHVNQRSNENSDELKDNIYIVQLLKDLSSVGKLSEIPLQSQKNLFSVPYEPRLRRQLSMIKRQGDN